MVWIDSVRSTANPRGEDRREDDREGDRAGCQRHVVVVGHVVGDERAEDADDHHHRPVDARHVAAQPELDREQDDEEGTGDVGRLRQPEAEVVVEVVGGGLAHRGAHDLDDPEEDRDLWDLVEHLAAERGRAPRMGGGGHGARGWQQGPERLLTDARSGAGQDARAILVAT
jgi:hypothetical protein